MKRNMTFPIRFWGILLAFLLLYQFSTTAEASDCKYEKKINLELDLSDSQSLAINALAGDLQIYGVEGSISAKDFGGDFRVDKDGSGSINSSNVKGSVTIPNQK